MKDFLIENKDWFLGILSGVFGWFGGRKLKKTTEKSAELENLKTIREMEKELVQTAKKQAEELREIIKDMQGMIDEKDRIINEKDKIIAQQQSILNRQNEFLKKCKSICKIDLPL